MSTFPSEWREKYRHGFLPGMEELITVTAAAEELFSFSSVIVPGLLQTEPYARAVTEDGTPYPVNQAYVDSVVGLRMARQWSTFERDPPLRMEFIIDESVIHREMGGPQVLHEQLVHILKITTQSLAVVRIFPFSAGTHWVSFNAAQFVILKSHESIFLSVEQPLQQQDNTHGRLEKLYYQGQYDWLAGKSWTTEETQACIEAKIRSLAKGPHGS